MTNECYDDGASCAFDRCRFMVLKYAPKLMEVGDAADAVVGLRTRVPFEESDLAQMRTLFTDGENASKVARLFGRKKNAVQKIFAAWRKHGAT